MVLTGGSTGNVNTVVRKAKAAALRYGKAGNVGNKRKQGACAP